jgi:hypothetical protein
MNYPRHFSSRALAFSLAGLLLFASCVVLMAQTTQARTPTETVREFYQALHEKRFREAFALSIYKPAVEGLSAEEFADLQPDFEKMAAAIPEKVNINGEQISGTTATVFVKVAEGADAEPVTLMRSGNNWIIGDKDNDELVRASGKEFFFKARIETHQNEVQEMLRRIQIAELAYSSQHANAYADLPTLIKAALVPQDLESTESTGYRFSIKLLRDAKSYAVYAEPARYNRTGRLSFYMDQDGIKSADVGGKPLIVATDKQ